MREIRIVYLETHDELTTITRQSEKIIFDMNGDVYTFKACDDAWVVAVASERFVTYTEREVANRSAGQPASQPDRPARPPTGSSERTSERCISEHCDSHDR